LSINADILIVRKLPEFVKKNCPSSGKFQRLVKFHVGAARTVTSYPEFRI
jgi:hypothetical protein